MTLGSDFAPAIGRAEFLGVWRLVSDVGTAGGPPRGGGGGTGLGSGIVMTRGSDFAPAIGRAEFLGVWRLVSDVGTAGGPLVVAGVEPGAAPAPPSPPARRR